MCFEYDDHADIYDETLVRRTCSPHPCEACSQMIPARSPAMCQHGLFEHEWFRRYVCIRCWRLILSIVAEEIKEGCDWSEAWCAPWDLQEYLRGRHEPVPLIGMRTVQDCRRYLDDLWMRRTSRMVASEEDVEILLSIVWR